MEKSDVLDLLIEFGGGAELLFGNVKKHKVQLQQEESFKWTIRKLLPWIQKNLLKERSELFIQDDSVRPGILVLVNDADWELLKASKSAAQNDLGWSKEAEEEFRTAWLSINDTHEELISICWHSSSLKYFCLYFEELAPDAVTCKAIKLKSEWKKNEFELFIFLDEKYYLYNL